MKGKVKSIGIIGCGKIGSYIAKAAVEHAFARVDFVFDADSERAQSIDGVRVLEDLSQIDRHEVDLVIETATAEVVRAIAPDVLGRSDLLIFSLTGLADDAFRELLRERCRQHGTRLFIPHGAILGLDGIYDGRALLEEVSITTTKNPLNLGLKEPSSGILYDGPTRGACSAFPRNVNIHAAVALAGLGFDRTHSVVVADPETDQMRHDIHVKGVGFEWNIALSSFAAVGKGVTGSYTPESAATTVRRILASDYDILLS